MQIVADLVDRDGRPQERLEEHHLGARVARGSDGVKRAAAAERHREEKLVGQMLTDRRSDAEVARDLVGHTFGDSFGRDAALAEAGEDLGHVLALDRRDERVARSVGRTNDVRATGAPVPTELREERGEIVAVHTPPPAG